MNKTHKRLLFYILNLIEINDRFCPLNYPLISFEKPESVKMHQAITMKTDVQRSFNTKKNPSRWLQ